MKREEYLEGGHARVERGGGGGLRRWGGVNYNMLTPPTDDEMKDRVGDASTRNRYGVNEQRREDEREGEHAGEEGPRARDEHHAAGHCGGKCGA